MLPRLNPARQASWRPLRAGRRFFTRPDSDHAAALTGRFASRQHRSLARPVRRAAAFGVGLARRVLQTACRVPQAAKEPRTTRPKEDTHDRRRNSRRSRQTHSTSSRHFSMKATATGSPRCSRRWAASTSTPGTTSASSRVSARRRRASRAFRPGARWAASSARARRASRSWRRSSADARR